MKTWWRRVGLRRRLALVSALLGGLVLTGCGSPGAQSAVGNGSTGGADLQVVASFYPLQYVAERVAASAATVSTLTKPGAEPHDLELTPRDVARLGDASLVVYLDGLQPAVDEAVAQEAADRAFDAADAGRLDRTYTPMAEGEEHTEEEGEEHVTGERAVDPHFWLDPTRLADVGDALADRLAELAPEQAAVFESGAAALRRDLATLDAEMAKGLANCADRSLVTSHNAFGYLADRYGLEQVGITGLTPESEPSSADLAAVSAFVRANKVRTIYYETLVSPAVAEAIARETGAATAVLDPVEGLTEESAGSDYVEVMRANLASLRTGQACR